MKVYTKEDVLEHFHNERFIKRIPDPLAERAAAIVSEMSKSGDASSVMPEEPSMDLLNLSIHWCLLLDISLGLEPKKEREAITRCSHCSEEFRSGEFAFVKTQTLGTIDGQEPPTAYCKICAPNYETDLCGYVEGGIPPDEINDYVKVKPFSRTGAVREPDFYDLASRTARPKKAERDEVRGTIDADERASSAEPECPRDDCFPDTTCARGWPDKRDCKIELLEAQVKEARGLAEKWRSKACKAQSVAGRNFVVAKYEQMPWEEE